MEQTSKIKVIIKPRPRIQREKDAHEVEQWTIAGDTIECRNPLCQHRYTFDKIYSQTATNDELYRNEVQPIVDQVINGYHGTIFAYGQTSSGKTYTMLGTKHNPGIIRKAAEQIFDGIQRAGDGKMFLIKANYFEIYNEKVYDLLNGRKELKLIELPNGELNIEEGKEIKAKEEIIQIIDNGNALRKTAETRMNVQSSRSHAVLQIVLQSIDSEDSTLVRVLNLVDLAGSERAEQTGATGERLKEAGNINKSLLTLSRVIEQLSEKSEDRIPYRDSKLTRMLQNSLGGNSMTTIICAITLVALEETNNTLGFAMRAKKIENKPMVNEVVSDAVEVKRMKKQITALENELKQHRDEIEKYQKMQTDLDFLNTVTIRSSSNVKSSHRRQTWGGDAVTMIPIHVESPSSTKPNNLRDHRALGSVLGLANEVAETVKSNGSTQNTQDSIEEETWIDAVEAFKVPTKIPPMKRSLLAVSTSFRSPVHRTTLTTSKASPIALDKDKRIKALEAEIAELQHFQTTEAELKNQDQLNKLQSELDGKVSEIAEKTSQLKQANTDRAVAVEAKLLAEQKMVSIEYEFEQHKERTARREKELIDEINSLNNDETVRALKEKLQTMTERAKSFETELWQNQSKHTTAIEAIKQDLNTKRDEVKALQDRLDKMNELQKEYDEVSVQVMGYIEENDDLTKKNEELQKQCDLQNAELEQNRLTILELERKDDEMMEVKKEFNLLLAEYEQLEHNNNISNSVFNQARMTIDCFKKECDILRNALAEAQAILAQQELDNLKLQKSICDYNDTINASQLNETCNINNNNNGPLIEMTAQLEKANTERDNYASKLAAIESRLSEVAGIEGINDTQNCLEKLLSTFHEFNAVEQKAQTAIDRLQNELSDALKAKDNIELEYKQAMDQLTAVQKQMEDAIADSKGTVSNLQSEIQTLSMELKRLSDQEKELMQNANENASKANIEMDRLQNELTEMTKNKDAIEMERNQLIEQLSSQNKLAEDTKVESQSTIASLRSDVASLSARIEQLASNEESMKLKLSEHEAKAKQDIANLQNELTITMQAKNSVEMERSQLVSQLETMNKDLEATNTEKSTTISKLQAEIQSLTAQLQQFASHENELKQTVTEKETQAKAEIASLQEEVATLKKTKQCIELEQKQTAEKLNSLMKTIENDKQETEKTIANFQSKIQSLQSQFDKQAQNEQELKNDIAGYEAKLARLQNELNAVEKVRDDFDVERKQLADRLNALDAKESVSVISTSKSSNAKHDQSTDIQKLRDENRLLYTQQQQLQEEIDNLRKSTNCDRKKKRQSLHDDTRRLSGFDATMIDIGQQTDPVDQKCACMEMACKIDKLKDEKLILQVKLKTQLENSGVNSLHREIKALKAKIEEYKDENRKLTYYHDDVRKKYDEARKENDELKIKAEMCMEKAATAAASTQTEPMTGATFVEQMDWDRVNRRAENYKSHYQQAMQAFHEAEKNLKKSEAERIMIQSKYGKVKEICNQRFIVLEENQAKIAEYEQKIHEFHQNEVRLQNELVVLRQSMQQTPEDTVAFRQLTSKFNELKEQHIQNMQKCQETANALDHFKAKYGETKTERDLLQQQLADMKSEMDSLQQQLSDMTGERDSLREKYNRVRELYLAHLVFKGKYAKAKEICNGRLERIAYLEGQLRRNNVPFAIYYEAGNENVPNN